MTLDLVARLRTATLSVLVSLGCAAGVAAQSSGSFAAARPKVLVVTAHPDDWEGIAGGTVLMLSRTHDIHVAIASRGERGIKASPGQRWSEVTPSAETARIRTAEAEASAKTIGARLYWLGSVDGEVYADQTRIDSVAGLMRRLDPAMVISMWGVDVPDHAAAGHMAIRAGWQTGLIHTRDFYFGEAQHGGQTQQFDANFYVNVDSFAEAKLHLLALHDSQNIDNELVESIDAGSKYYGQLAKVGYAEPFRTYYPIVDERFGRSGIPQLLRLGAKTEPTTSTPPTVGAPARKPRLLVVGAHPGDWEDGCGGTVWKLRETHDVTIVCASRGEMGAGGDAPERVGPAREAETLRTAAELGAAHYFLGEPDAGIQARPTTVDSLARIIERVDPDIVLTMWALDVADHAATSAMTVQAMTRTGHLYSADLYFYESDAGSQTVSFDPAFYVNIDGVIEAKRRLLRTHATENPGDILDANMMAKARFRGASARCEYAEGLIPFFPLINERWRAWSFGG